jgi:hypothetical protein
MEKKSLFDTFVQMIEIAGGENWQKTMNQIGFHT